MFSPDALAPALIALPYLAATAKFTVGLIRPRLLLIKPGYCKYLPWFCPW